MVTTVPNDTVSFHGGGGGFPTLNDEGKLVQYPNGDAVRYTDYFGLVQLLNPNVQFPKTGWVVVPGDKLAIKCSNTKVVYTEQQMKEILETERERVKQYRATPQGQKTGKKYVENRDPEKHREDQRRYAASEKGQTTIADYNKNNSRVPLPKPDSGSISFDDVAAVMATAVPVHDTSFNNNNNNSYHNNTNDATEAGNLISQMLESSNDCLKQATSSNFNFMVGSHRKSLQSTETTTRDGIVWNLKAAFEATTGRSSPAGVALPHPSSPRDLQLGQSSPPGAALPPPSPPRDLQVEESRPAAAVQRPPSSPRDLQVEQPSPAAAVLPTAKHHVEKSMETMVNSNDGTAVSTEKERELEILGDAVENSEERERATLSNVAKLSKDGKQEVLETIVGSPSQHNPPTGRATSRDRRVGLTSPAARRRKPPPPPPRDRLVGLASPAARRRKPPPPPPRDPPVGQPSPGISSGSLSNVSNNYNDTKKKKSVSFDPNMGEGTDKVQWVQVDLKLREAKTIEEAGEIILHTVTDHEHLRENMVAYVCDWKIRSQQKSSDLHKMGQENKRLHRQLSNLKTALPLGLDELIEKNQLLMEKNQLLAADYQRVRGERDDVRASYMALEGKYAAVSNEARNHHRQHQRRNLVFSPIKQGKGWSPIIDKNKAVNDRYQQREQERQRQREQQLFLDDELKENRRPSHQQQQQEERQRQRQVLMQAQAEYPDDELPDNRRPSRDQQQQQEDHRRQQTERVQAEYRDDNSSGIRRRSRHSSSEEEYEMPPSKKSKF